MIASLLFRRELQIDRPQILSRLVRQDRASSLQLSQEREIDERSHKSPVNCLRIDLVEQRYLLSGGGDCKICCFDVGEDFDRSSSNKLKKLKPLFVLDKTNGHKFSVSGVDWYPVDTGMFVSASFDESIRVWDTNTQTTAAHFSLPGPVYAVAMSPLASSHCLIAGGSTDSHVRLCDLRTGACTHMLSGHKDSVRAVQWSPRDEHVLASGSLDGTILVWDVRRAGGPLKILDQHNTSRASQWASSSASNSSAWTAPELRGGESSSTSSRRQDKRQRNGKTGSSSSASKRTRLEPNRMPEPVIWANHSKASTSTAHSGAVTALCYTPDGLFLLSSGTDERLRLWNTFSGLNTLVNFGGTKNQHKKGTAMCTDNDGRFVFHPNGDEVWMYEIHSGTLCKRLKGHFEGVNCCVYHPSREEMYSGGADRQILIYTPGGAGQLLKADIEGAQDGDNWSDDEQAR
mmetsp:Transcript_35876/g.57994  ORF Transcript_35876/g.57994 Transcript_35876/m.57994 type:complete len:459 (+) Transcript_35876:115-1491(+)|eukprot:CAMPEP_0184676186 /NCGR_PEP_ID=MMETSP0308-20130426/88214_1 /TAXON_ID=38269 /ORGANISM="Gloeochaete witrockiana, Strain SAG 46.84" /LENGTH=458 /DNA_ID=CAMNT_0027123997 /DNA_START=1308 /DNA_END=2684 /DNA_ORIENTATION=+